MDTNLEQTFQIPSSVTLAKQRAAKLTAEAASRSAAQPTVSDILKEKALEAYGYNQDLIGKLDPAIASYVSAPSVGREKYQDIFNPFSREKLVSQYVGSQAIPMQALSSVLGQRFGRIEDAVGVGTRRYEAEERAAINRAELARQEYNDALSEYTFLEQLSGASETRGLARERFEWEKTQPRGGGSVSERTRAGYINDLARQVREGMNLKTAISTYKDSLSRPDILSTYNTNTPFDSYRESSDEIDVYFEGQTELEKIIAAGGQGQEKEQGLVSRLWDSIFK